MNSNSLIEANRATVTRFLNGAHSGNLSVIEETVAGHIVTHGFPGGQNPASHEQYRQFFVDFGKSFSGMDYKPTAMIANTERVAVRFEIAVTHTGPFAGVAATGRRVTFTGMAIYRMENAKIAGTWLQLDELAILAQIGAVSFNGAESGNAAAA
ncbi:MAG: ester cyclase [Rhodomicrobiaceae bacterium]